MSEPEVAPPGTSWSGTYRYTARALHRPTSEPELQQRVSSSRRIRPLGTRHAFTAVSDSEGDLVSTLALPEVCEVDSARSQVRVSAGTTYGRLAELLAPHGLALANLPSLPHVCVGGAVATGTHGSGRAIGSLASQVAGLRVVLATGDVVEVTRDDADFAGHVVSLGALGVVTALDLDVQPTYEVAQWAMTGGRPADLVGGLDDVMALGDSVSVFTRWSGPLRVLVKSRAPVEPPSHPLLATETASAHVLPDGDASAMTEQGGRPGPWHQRLPHFRLDAIPSKGSEIQSEWFVPYERGPEAIAAMARLAGVLDPVLLVSEIRTVAADDLWLSGAHGSNVVALHCTWRPDPEAVDAAVRQVEAALLPYGPRPHWGKRFLLPADHLHAGWPRLGDFVRLAHGLDPGGTFSNPFLREAVGL